MNIVTIFIGHALCACATKKKKQPNGAEWCKLHSKLLNYIHGNPLTLSQWLNFLSFFKTFIKVYSSNIRSDILYWSYDLLMGHILLMIQAVPNLFNPKQFWNTNHYMYIYIYGTLIYKFNWMNIMSPFENKIILLKKQC